MHANSLIVMLLISLPSAVATAEGQRNEALLKQQYDAFVESLDHRSLAEDYPGAVRNLDSPDSKQQIVGIKALAATEEPKAIPWIVPFLDSEDRNVRIYAGQALNALVATHQLKRRDKTQPERVVILPPAPGDIDLTPMSWVILKMLQKPDDGNTHAFAANVIGYLGLEEYEAELRQLVKSRHPAVTRAAGNALEMLGCEQPDAFTKAELQAAKTTGKAFGELFRDRDEDSLGLLLVPKGDLASILNPQILEGKDTDSLYGKMVSANTQRFIEFRNMCGDMSKLSSITFQPGHLVASDFYAADMRVMKNSYVVFAYANRVEIKVKIEEMVFVDGRCYVVEID